MGNLTPHPDSRSSSGLIIAPRRTLDVPYSPAVCLNYLQHMPAIPYASAHYKVEVFQQSETRCDLVIRCSASSRPVAKNGAATIFCALTGDETKTHIDMTAFPSKDGLFFGFLGLVFLVPFFCTFLLCGQIIFNGVALNNPLVCEAAFMGFIGLFAPLCLGVALTMHRTALQELLDYLQKPEAYAEAKP